MSQYDLLSVGDVSLDVFLNPSETETLCDLNTKDCYICFSYGDKIPVKNLDFSIGGNAGNNAVGAGRLGIKVGLCSTMGGDSVGNQIVEKLQKEGVDLTYTIQQPTALSNYSTVINYGGERTIFSYHAPRSYEFPVQLPVTTWMYVTSMGETFVPFFNHLLDWLTKNPSVKVAFNPGSRQLRAGASVIQPMLLRTELLYVNREEAEMITGEKESHGQEKELIKKLSSMGPKIVVVTDGDKGGYAFDGQAFYKYGTLPVDAYERTGAGDSFGCACLAALIKGHSLKDALLWGIVNAASVIGYVGAQKGLLHEQEMPVWLERAKSSNVQVVQI